MCPAIYSPAAAAVHRAHRAGEEAEAVDDRRNFVVQHPDARLAAVERFERGERLGVPFDRVGELQEQRGPLRRRRRRPAREGLFGGVDGGVHLLNRGFRQVEQKLLRLRIEHALAGLAAGDELVADQHVCVEHETLLSRLQLLTFRYFPAPATCSPSRVR